MKTTALTLLALTTAAFAQGPLTPPGAPAATGKSLTEIYNRTEMRTPISSLPYTINVAGSYYLTNDLVGSGVTGGIHIDVTNVTLDLNGFTINGNATTAGSGITASGVSQVVVRNGHVSGWAGMGVDLGSANNAAIERITVRATTGVGIRSGYYSSVSDCRVDEVGDSAFQIGGNSSVRNCIADRPTGVGFILGDDVIADHLVVYQTLGLLGTGITLGEGATLTDSAVKGTSQHGITTFARATVRNCTVDAATGLGIYMGEDSVAERVTVNHATVGGISLESDCTLSGATVRNIGGIGIETLDRGSVSDCTVQGTAGDGISIGADSVAERVSVRQVTAGGVGIRLAAGAKLSAATVKQSASHGIVGQMRTSLRDCTVDGAAGDGITLGIESAGAGLTVRNTTNGGVGIRLDTDGSLTGATVRSAASYGIFANTRCALRECSANINGNFGIYALNEVSIDQCSASANSQGGISLGQNCALKQSTMSRHYNPAWVTPNVNDGAWPGVQLRHDGTIVHSCTFENNDVVYWGTIQLGNFIGYSAFTGCSATVSMRNSGYANIVRGSSVATSAWFEFGYYYTYFDRDNWADPNTYTPITIPPDPL